MGARLTRRLSALALLVASSGVTFGCSKKDEPTESRPLPVKPASEKLVPPPAPVEVLALEETAYGPSLSFQGENLILLTTTAAYRIAPGEAPARVELPLGAHRALVEDRVAYWKDGVFYEVALSGGPSKALGKAAIEPRAVQASGQRFFWLAEEADGANVLFTFEAGKPRELYRSTAGIGALAALDNSAFFTERSGPTAWRIGGVSLDGGPVTWSRVQEGRIPSMLASERQLFFYDGPVRGVRSLLPDLSNEVAIAENVICSPLAVSTHVFCAQVGGLFEVGTDLPKPRILTEQPFGHVATVAASPTHVAWLNDAGENKLVLRVQERMKP
jgi:hypothetical protein